MNLDEYVKVVGDYADQLATAKATGDKDSVRPAMAMADMFEDKATWVARGLDLVPLPKDPKSNRARVPDTMERFHKVTNALLADGGHARFASANTTSAHIGAGRTARHIPKSLAQGFRTVEQVKPLQLLLTSGDIDRIPEAARIAIEESGGKAPSSAIVRRVARAVLHDANKRRAANATAGHAPIAKLDRLNAKRSQAEQAVVAFLDLAAQVKAKDRDAAQTQLDYFRDFLKEELTRRKR